MQTRACLRTRTTSQGKQRVYDVVLGVGALARRRPLLRVLQLQLQLLVLVLEHLLLVVLVL